LVSGRQTRNSGIQVIPFYAPRTTKQLADNRSASRIGESDGQINRKRIRAIRKELEKVGWRSAGF